MLHPITGFAHTYDPDSDGDDSGELAAQSVPAAEHVRVCRQRDELLDACMTWIEHYDEYVREPSIGDERGIAAMRRIVDEINGAKL